MYRPILTDLYCYQKSIDLYTYMNIFNLKKKQNLYMEVVFCLVLNHTDRFCGIIKSMFLY